MRYLIAPIGIYLGRVKTGIIRKSPDEIYLIAQKSPSKWSLDDPDYKQIVERDLLSGDFLHAKDRDGKVHKETVESTTDYDSCFKKLFKLISAINQNDRNPEIFIDITSAPEMFHAAAIAVAECFRNTAAFYTERGKAVLEDTTPDSGIYSDEERLDEGGKISELIYPRIDVRDITAKESSRRKILVKLASQLEGREYTNTKDLAMYMDLKYTPQTSSMLWRHLRVLEDKGLVKLYGVKPLRIEITNFGRALAKALQ